MRDFISTEKRNYRFQLGTTVASALSGFIAGVIATSIFWAVSIEILKSTLQ